MAYATIYSEEPIFTYSISQHDVRNFTYVIEKHVKTCATASRDLKKTGHNFLNIFTFCFFFNKCYLLGQMVRLNERQKLDKSGSILMDGDPEILSL